MIVVSVQSHLYRPEPAGSDLRRVVGTNSASSRLQAAGSRLTPDISRVREDRVALGVHPEEPDDALEIVHAAELDDDLPLAPTYVDLDPRVEAIRQPLGKVGHRWRYR